jgi:hypothetical protein
VTSLAHYSELNLARNWVNELGWLLGTLLGELLGANDRWLLALGVLLGAEVGWLLGTELGELEGNELG